MEKRCPLRFQMEDPLCEGPTCQWWVMPPEQWIMDIPEENMDGSCVMQTIAYKILFDEE